MMVRDSDYTLGGRRGAGRTADDRKTAGQRKDGGTTGRQGDGTVG